MFITVDDRWLMWFANQFKLLNSPGDGTAPRQEPDGIDFSQVSPTRDSDIPIFFSASAASKPNFSPIAFQIFILVSLFFYKLQDIFALLP